MQTRALPKVAVIDTDVGALELLRSVLEQQGARVERFLDPRSFLDRPDLCSFEVVFCQLNLRDQSGVEVFRQLRRISSRPRFVLLADVSSVAAAVRAVKEGVDEVLVCPFRVDDVISLAARLGRSGPEAEEEPGVPGSPGGRTGVAAKEPAPVGASHAWVILLGKARQVASLGATVLIRGETGTGKEVIARYIVSQGPPARRACVTLNCAAIPDQLIESELFGHVRGAFSGATGPRRGIFEEADGGTLYLDEVGTLPLPAQAKVLRALEEGKVRRVGDNRSIHVDVRIIASTNLEMETAIASHEFRDDLYYRLSVITLWIPPLRERREDILPLAEHFLRMLTPQRPLLLSPGARSFLEGYPFPGNVRELKHALVQAAAFAREDQLMPDDFLFLRARSDFLPATPSRLRGAVLEAPDVTRESLDDALQRTSGNRVEAARLLGISRSTLYRLIRKLPFEAAS